MSKSVNNVQELGMLANSMTRDYSALAGDCRGAVAASTNPQVSCFGNKWISQLESIRSFSAGVSIIFFLFI